MPSCFALMCTDSGGILRGETSKDLRPRKPCRIQGVGHLRGKALRYRAEAVFDDIISVTPYLPKAIHEHPIRPT